jgi:hypothetical protein
VPTKRKKVDPPKVKQPDAIQFHSGPLPAFDPNADMTPIVDFLEAFRLMVDVRAQNPSKLISIKIPEPLLAAFKFKAAQCGVPYQRKIKELMLEWVRQ